MVFAGPVFTGWYFGPLFFLAVFSPVILALAALLNWRVRRIARVRRWATTAVRRYALVAAALVASALLVAGARDWWLARAFERDAHAQAVGLAFEALAPQRAPRGYRTERVSAGRDSLFFEYARGSRYLWLLEHAANRFAGPGAECDIAGIGDVNPWYGPCRAARTPAGDLVLVGVGAPVGHAFLVRSGTLVEATYGGGATEAEALALLDELAPVDASALDFERQRLLQLRP